MGCGLCHFGEEVRRGVSDLVPTFWKCLVYFWHCLSELRINSRKALIGGVLTESLLPAESWPKRAFTNDIIIYKPYGKGPFLSSSFLPWLEFSHCQRKWTRETQPPGKTHACLKQVSSSRAFGAFDLTNICHLVSSSHQGNIRPLQVGYIMVWPS